MMRCWLVGWLDGFEQKVTTRLTPRERDASDATVRTRAIASRRCSPKEGMKRSPRRGEVDSFLIGADWWI